MSHDAKTGQSDASLFVLNTAYTVFLGVFVQYLFKVDVVNGRPVVDVLITGSNAIPICLICAYFLVDWLTANLTVSLRSSLNHLVLILLLVFIGILGAALILAIEPSLAWYALLAGYGAAVAFWDLYVYSGRDHDQEWPAVLVVFLGLVITARVAIAAIMLFVIILNCVGGPDNLDHMLVSFYVLFLMYLAVKVFRYVLYLFLSGSRATHL